MPRRDYFHEADAPKANSIVVAAAAYVEDSAGRLLLVRRSDNGAWALPGGQQEVGETTVECAERETFEETGIRIRVTNVVDVLSDPQHVIEYDDGEIRQEFVVLYRAQPLEGELRGSDETPSVEWADVDGLDQYEMRPWIRARVNRARRA